MGRLQVIRTELDTDPLSRGVAYTGTDVAAAIDLNTKYRPNEIDIATLLKFLVLDNVHSTDGNDTQDRAIWQRMLEVRSLAVVPSAAVANPWGSTAIGNVTEIRQVKTHQLVSWIELSAQGNLRINTADSNFQVYVAGAQAAGCMSTAQETALNALSDDQQTRGEELGVGRVSETDVNRARAL